MASVTFDTLSFAKRLQAAGFTIEQAETLARMQAELIDERLVTKEYLDAKLADTRAELVKWVAGLMLAQAAVIAALVKLL